MGQMVMTALMLMATIVAVPLSGEELGPGGTFFDDDGNVHEGYIEALAATWVLRGCNPPLDDLICPRDSLTRGQLAALLQRAAALPSDGSDAFSDDNGTTFEADIDAIAAAGIARGCDPPANTRFCPNRTVTRGELAAFLVRLADLPPGPSGRFVDDTGTFEGDIEALAAAGITNGCNPPANDRYCPDRPVRRDEAASLLARTLGLAPIHPPPRPAFELAASGDILIHLQLTGRAASNAGGSGYDFGPMFDEVRPILAGADLALCHLEVPLSATNTGLSGYPTFNAPHQLAAAIAEAGYDGCSTASNHSLDQGFGGVIDTLDALDAAGVGHTGTARSAAEAAGVRTYEVGTATIAHLSYSYGFNGIPLPAGRPYAANLIDVERILDDAADAREAGAGLVAVSLHWGAEYQQAPTSFQLSVAGRLLSSDDVDVILGHHAHVVQPVGYRAGEYVVYGMGNFLSGQRFLASVQDGVIVHLDVAQRGDRWAVRSVSFTPTWVEAVTYRILPAPDLLAEGDLSAGLAAALSASQARTSQAITALDAPAVRLRTGLE